MQIKIYNENSQRIGIHAKQPQGVGVGVNVNTAIDDINKHIAEIEEDLKSKGIHYIPKTAFVCTEGADNLSMRWDLNSVEGITQPFAGMSIALQIPLVSTFTSGVVLSIDGVLPDRTESLLQAVIYVTDYLKKHLTTLH